MDMAPTLFSLLNRVSHAAGGDKVVLEIDLARGVVTAPPDNPLLALRSVNSPSMRALRDGLRSGAADPKVLGLLVHIGSSPLSLTECEEVGDLIQQFARSKPTIAHSESFGELGNALAAYKLATACQEIWLQPSGQLGIGGVHLGITLLKGLANKAGLEPQFAQRFEYKTAGDQLAADAVTPANREMVQAIADSVVNEFVSAVAARRKLDQAEVRAAVDGSPLTAQAALEAKLIDRIGYRDAAMAHAFEAWGGSASDLAFVHRYGARAAKLETLRELADRSSPVIGVVNLAGSIVTGRGRPAGMPGGGQAGSDVISEQLRAATRDARVKAVILRIDSPGGSAVASDAIWRSVHFVRESGRPVVACMGNVAASGGYYSAMGADEIVALPGTLTGSIGVVGGKFVNHELLRKLAVVHESVDAGANAGMLSGDPFTDEQWAKLNEWLDAVYVDFTTKAAADRKLELDALQAVARGRVWTGSDALGHQLIDHLGGMDTAIERASALAGVHRDKAQLRAFPLSPMIARFRPVDNSESTAAVGTSLPLDLSGPEALITRLAEWSGLSLPGVLTMPWRFELR